MLSFVLRSSHNHGSTPPPTVITPSIAVGSQTATALLRSAWGTRGGQLVEAGVQGRMRPQASSAEMPICRAMHSRGHEPSRSTSTNDVLQSRRASFALGRLAAGVLAAAVALLCLTSFTACATGTEHAPSSTTLKPTTTVEPTTPTTTVPSNSSADGWLSDPLGRLPRGYGVSALLLLAFLVWQAVQSAARAYLGTLVGSVAVWRPWRWRPLLQPSPYVTVAEIEETGRIPIDPTTNGRGRIGPFRRIIISRIVPITPKPAFVLSTWNKVDGSTLPRDGSEFTTGGYRLQLRLSGTENPAHLASSIGAVRLRAPRVLLITTPEDYVNPAGKVHCCTIDWRHVKRARDRPDDLIVYSADPLRTRGSNYRLRKRSKVRVNGIWLISLDRRGGGPPPPQQAPDQGLRERHTERLRDRSRPIRRWWWPFATVGVLMLLSLLVPPSRKHLVCELSAVQYEVYALSGLILGYLGAVALAIRFAMHLRYERRAPAQWTATTTRCLSDGARVRNGMYKQLPPRSRYRINPVDPQGSTPPDALTAGNGEATETAEDDETASTDETGEEDEAADTRM